MAGGELLYPNRVHLVKLVIINRFILLEMFKNHFINTFAFAAVGLIFLAKWNNLTGGKNIESPNIFN